MNSDLNFQHAVEAGERNQEAKELIQNWCAHARVEKFGGTGWIEAQSGLPIGHHFMVCDHAPASGTAVWLLEESAIHFHDTHCVGCTKRQPVRLPNISKLIARRDSDAERASAHTEAVRLQQQAAYDSRCAARSALRATSTVEVATFVDDLQALDQTRDGVAGRKLIESARLAPELLTAEVVEHLFSLLEHDEHWFDEVGLTILGETKHDPTRLARCAMRCLAGGRACDLAAEIVAREILCVEAADVRGAIIGLAFVAHPPRAPFDHADSQRGNPRPLGCVVERFPNEAVRGIDELLSESDPFRVGLGARAITALAPTHPALMASLRRSLATRLTRVDTFVDANSESERRDVIHGLTEALVCSFLSDPANTDVDLMRYFEGASKEGEARLSGIYERIIRFGVGGFQNEEDISDFDAYRTALRRLIALAGTSDNQDVIRDIVEALRNEPGRLAPLAREQMDTLLGAAALTDAKLADADEHSPLITPPDLLAAMERRSRRQSLRSLRASFVRWATYGAASDASGLPEFTSFLGKASSFTDGLAAALVEELPPLMRTGEGLNAVLPFLYSCMVGKSNLVRSAAGHAIGEIGSRRLLELPELVIEAFLLMLSDRYVVVHKSAVHALKRVHLPEAVRTQASAALAHLILIYRGDADQTFMLTCMEAYASELCENGRLKPGVGKFFYALIREVKPDLLLRRNHQWLLRLLSEVEGYAESPRPK
ncbi:hypothetical protein [Ralstonia pseudosolanacearum]|uniref:hypothetical protein n=1 Tax=Ralstonia pseudosolanacearum TaxID=1310165 RepID=UPI0018D1273B|nr:hypothetical protein [Ralstonia pseudosolanacearum]BEU63466.1 hypothetical protein MAFF301524_32660 [Ralstonia pseudosolanacearum]